MRWGSLKRFAAGQLSRAAGSEDACDKLKSENSTVQHLQYKVPRLSLHNCTCMEVDM